MGNKFFYEPRSVPELIEKLKTFIRNRNSYFLLLVLNGGSSSFRHGYYI